MLVEAESNQKIDDNYLIIEKGDIIVGVCRAYNQNTILVDDLEELDDEPYFKTIKRRVEVVKGTIKRLVCGCNNYATKVIEDEPLCDECEYEKPEVHLLDTGYHAMDYLRAWD